MDTGFCPVSIFFAHKYQTIEYTRPFVEFCFAAAANQINSGLKQSVMKFILATLLLMVTAPRLFAQVQQISSPAYHPDLFDISSQYSEWTTAFTPDDQSVYYCIHSTPYVIVYSRLENGHWQQPEIASFSGTWNDTDPFISYDGQRVYFCSNRPADQQPASTPDKNYHIWMAENRGPNKWSAPVRLDDMINYPGVNSWYPSESENGNFYFHSYNRPGGHGKNDIYVSKREGNKFSQPELINIDSAGCNTQECRISKDDRFMLFVSDRKGGIGTTDIYISFRKDNKWSHPINLGAQVNSAQVSTMAPALSASANKIFFTNNYVPVATPAATINSYAALKQRLDTVYNGLWNIFSMPINIDAFYLHATW